MFTNTKLDRMVTYCERLASLKLHDPFVMGPIDSAYGHQTWQSAHFRENLHHKNF